MGGKFLQILPLKSAMKAMAGLIIVALAVAIYATREIPDNFGDDKEWEFLRNLDFAVCVVSLAFASVLFYGSITEFTMFILAWMIWNVTFTVFWIVFLALKYNELVEWERDFRAVAISLMIFVEFPALSYFRYLRKKHKDDPEASFSWMENQPSDKVYKTLNERPSFSSFNELFGKTSAVKNSGFQSDSARTSVVSEASEEIEQIGGGKVDKEDAKEITVKENEKVEEKEEGNEREKDESDAQSKSSFEISVTVHTTKTEGTDITAKGKENESSNDVEKSEPAENVAPAPEIPSSAMDVVTSAGQETRVTETDEKQREIPGYAASADPSVVVEMNDVKSSVAVEIDVTDKASEDFHQTSF